jgi:hypothetical protein
MTSGCAQLHHVQLSDINNHPGYLKTSIDIKVSETGVNLGEAKDVAKIFANKKGQKQLDEVNNIIGMFQMGPRTGELVYNPTYARNLAEAIHAQCPHGQLTELMSVRESRKYPVISGEIVKITGYCLTPSGGK